MHDAEVVGAQTAFGATKKTVRVPELGIQDSNLVPRIQRGSGMTLG